MTPDPNTIADRATELWRETTAQTRRAGRTWYATAERDIAQLSALAPRGVGRVRAAAIFAVLSPQTQWVQNWKWAEQHVRAAGAGAALPPAGGFPNNREKAWRIANGADPDKVVRGPKVRAFWRALAGDRDACVLDLWMFRCFDLPDAPPIGTYRAVEQGVRIAAKRARVPVRDFQATLWLHQRGDRPADPDNYLRTA